jgi:tetratricopeptide (TPR) repeat protein
MSDVRDTGKEIRLRDRIASREATADDYLELASLMYEAQHFEQSIDTLRKALGMPFDDATRASLLVALGWYMYGVGGDVTELRALGERALKLTERPETIEASVARAKALYLVAECAFPDNLTLVGESAVSALSILEPLLETHELPKSSNRYELLITTAGLDELLGRFDAASQRCREAFEAASDRNQKLDSLVELGTANRLAGRLHEARKIFAEAILYRDVSPWALVRPYYELGQIEKALGMHAEARAKLREAIDILQRHPALPRGQLSELFRLSGEISYGLEDLEEAVRSFQSAVEQSADTDPLHWNSLLWLAYSQNSLGQNDSARDNASLVKYSLAAVDEDRAGAEVLLGALRSRANQN